MRKFLILVVLAFLAGAWGAHGETAIERAWRLSKENPEAAQRDSLWWEGMLYREWITDVNSVGDDNSNLDPEVFFVADGKVRAHPRRVYFYNDIDLGIQTAVETKLPLAFYLMDHSCGDCLYAMPNIYMNPEVVEKSRNFVNVYVRYPYSKSRILQLHMMTAAPSVQFLLPGLRRLRATNPGGPEDLLEVYDTMLKYIATLSEEEIMARPEYLN